MNAAQTNQREAGSEQQIEDVVADKGYHTNEQLAALHEHTPYRTYIPEPQSPHERVWTDKRSAIEIPAVDSAVDNIREQYLRLDPDEQRILLRILRQVERLDAALADLHLVLPTIEICFYGVRSGGRRLAAQPLRKLIQRWDAASAAAELIGKTKVTEFASFGHIVVTSSEADYVSGRRRLLLGAHTNCK